MLSSPSRLFVSLQQAPHSKIQSGRFLDRIHWDMSSTHLSRAWVALEDEQGAYHLSR
jgi:hypothetical protein